MDFSGVVFTGYMTLPVTVVVYRLQWSGVHWVHDSVSYCGCVWTSVEWCSLGTWLCQLLWLCIDFSGVVFTGYMTLSLTVVVYRLQWCGVHWVHDSASYCGCVWTSVVWCSLGTWLCQLLWLCIDFSGVVFTGYMTLSVTVVVYGLQWSGVHWVHDSVTYCGCV